jgi:hypothetical protein
MITIAAEKKEENSQYSIFVYYMSLKMWVRD